MTCHGTFFFFFFLLTTYGTKCIQHLIPFKSVPSFLSSVIIQFSIPYSPTLLEIRWICNWELLSLAAGLIQRPALPFTRTDNTTGSAVRLEAAFTHAQRYSTVWVASFRNKWLVNSAPAWHHQSLIYKSLKLTQCSVIHQPGCVCMYRRHCKRSFRAVLYLQMLVHTEGRYFSSESPVTIMNEQFAPIIHSY